MTIHHILITHQQNNVNELTLTASINVPKNLSNDTLNTIVEEFRQKILKHSLSNGKKVFSNFTNSPHNALSSGFTQPASVVQTDKSYLKEDVQKMAGSHILEALKHMGVISEKNTSNTNEVIWNLQNNSQVLFVNNEFSVINLNQSHVIYLNKQEFLTMVHRENYSYLSFEDFCKQILNSWDSISY